MDEGAPIAYPVLDQGVKIYASDGEVVGTVDHVVAAQKEDIFHGIVMRTHDARLFIPADQIASLHELGVDLRIDAQEAATLSEPHGAAIARKAYEPGMKPSRWTHMLDKITGKDPSRRDWTDED